MHPAVIDCYAVSPGYARTWFEGAIVRYSDLLEVGPGVAATSWAAALSSYAEASEQLQTAPRQTLPIVAKTFAPAMRHGRTQHRLATNPASCGADIFPTCLGKCAFCAEAVLRMREAASTAPAEADAAMAADAAAGAEAGTAAAVAEQVPAGPLEEDDDAQAASLLLEMGAGGSSSTEGRTPQASPTYCLLPLVRPTCFSSYYLHHVVNSMLWTAV